MVGLDGRSTVEIAHRFRVERERRGRQVLVQMFDV